MTDSQLSSCGPIQSVFPTPACLHENSNRLVTLWDILQIFDVGSFTAAFSLLVHQETILTHERLRGRGNEDLDTATCEIIMASIKILEKMYGKAGLGECVDHCKTAFSQIIAGHLDLSSTGAILASLKLETIKRLQAHEFLSVALDRLHRVYKRELLGHEVSSAFPSAGEDIMQAGNCMASECCTAAVFHLMRAAEYGPRSLAADRRVQIPRGIPIELATWEDILKRLEESEDAIRQYPKTLAREAQYDFYHGAMMELKRFKNKFRNTVMHTRIDYDRDEAESAFGHVRAFMQILASHISEHSVTPEVWV